MTIYLRYISLALVVFVAAVVFVACGHMACGETIHPCCVKSDRADRLRTDTGQALATCVLRGAAAHRGEHLIGDVLQRHVEIFTDVVALAHDVQDIRREARREGVNAGITDLQHVLRQAHRSRNERCSACRVVVINESRPAVELGNERCLGIYKSRFLV